MNMSLSQETTAPQSAPGEIPLRGVRPNIVQSIRAFRVQELQDAAQTLGQHFLYASLANAQTKQDVLDLIGQQVNLLLLCPDDVLHAVNMFLRSCCHVSDVRACILLQH